MTTEQRTREALLIGGPLDGLLMTVWTDEHGHCPDVIPFAEPPSVIDLILRRSRGVIGNYERAGLTDNGRFAYWWS